MFDNTDNSTNKVDLKELMDEISKMTPGERRKRGIEVHDAYSVMITTGPDAGITIGRDC